MVGDMKFKKSETEINLGKWRQEELEEDYKESRSNPSNRSKD